MSLKDKIESLYSNSIKEKDTNSINTLRLIKSAIKDKEIAEALELPPIKIHCSVLAEDSIQRAIRDWEEKKAGRNTTWLEQMTTPKDEAHI